jgi:hypothetical protein
VIAYLRDFSQLVNKASIYEESLKENAAEYADQKRRTQGTGTLVGESEVVTGTAPILGFEASVLFDSGATHSFVSKVLVRLSSLVVRTLEPGLIVTTPVGKTVVCKHVVCECLVSIYGRILPSNLVVLPMFSYDVILGMDWLTRHSVIINCVLKQVTLTP